MCCAVSHYGNSLANHSFEALLFFLYTDDIRFAPFSSATRHEPVHARAKLPSPSAKSIYRLANKVTSPVFVRIPPSHQL